MAESKRTSRTWARVVIGALLLGAVAVAGTLSVPGVLWRAKVLGLASIGMLPDITLRELIPMLAPAWPHSLERLAAVRNPYLVVRNPMMRPTDVAAGADAFRQRCAFCHGADGHGGVTAPALTGRVLGRGASDWALYRVIRDGVPNTSMPAHPISSEDVWRLAAYVRSVNVAAVDAPLIIDAAVKGRTAAASVSTAELNEARFPGDDWLMYSGAYNGMRHSSLESIHPANVKQLAPRWIFQYPATGRMETSPVVRNGVLYLTGPGLVVALDAATGAKLWQWQRTPPPDAVGAPGLHNRGVALFEDKVYVGTADARLFALSASTGEMIWNVPVSDYRSERQSVTGAPLVVGDAIVVGVAVSFDRDLVKRRGHISAFDARTGAPRWRFETVPGPGEPGHESWGNDSWREGGTASWLTGSYEPATDTLYWGIGNPSPDYNALARPGDNLYSCSVVALRGATGKLVWHFQFSPNDDHDWDATQIPILADFATPSGIEKRLLTANRNGFYYVLDRDSGRFVMATPFVKQTWASGMDARGRPIRTPIPAESDKGILVHPSNVGGTNWWSPSMDPARKLFFVPTLERGQIFFPGKRKGNFPAPTGSPHYTAVRALDAASGRLVWEHRHPPRYDHDETGGLLSTKSGLVFGADMQTFFALDAKTGQRLWAFATGGHIAAAPVTYAANGRQFVAIAAGASLIAFGLPP